MNAPLLNPNSHPPSGATAQAASTKASRRIIDAPTRVFHWLFAICFLGAYLTADGESWRLVHITLGYTIIGLMVFRIGWGIFGPRRVQFASWWGKVKSLPSFLQGFKTAKPQWLQGANGTQALAVLSLMLVSVLTTASGFVFYHEYAGEWMGEVHELLGDAFLIIVLAHLALLVIVSVLRRRHEWLVMITGKQAGKGPDLVKNNLLWLGIVLVLLTAAGWAWQWQNAPAVKDPAQASQKYDAGDEDGDDD